MAGYPVRQTALGLALFLGSACPVFAGSLTVNPVRLTLSGAQPIGALMVRNGGPEATVVQLEAFSWSQQAGKDVYAPTKEVLATPPIFTVPPGGSQIVRVGLRRPGDPQRELTYRLYLQEVPPPPQPGFQGLQVALRLGVPVFVTSGAIKPVLRWQAQPAPRGALKISATNAGNSHIQIADFRLASVGRNQPLAAQEVAAYLLPGQSRDWLVKPERALPSDGRLQLLAHTDAGEAHAEIPLGAP